MEQDTTSRAVLAQAAEAPVLADAVRRFARGSVMVVGDAMLDRYVFGSVSRISPEAPVPVLAIERDVAMPGGAANVMRCLAALGTAVAFVSVVGDDQAGSDLTGLIGGQPGVEPWLLVQGGRTTTLKTRFVAGGQHLLRADQEQADPIHAKLAERLLRICRDAMAATTVTVLADYAKGVLAGGTAAALVTAARHAGRRIVVDPRGADFARYAGADLLTPCRDELRAATTLALETRAEISAAAQTQREKHGFGAILVTVPSEALLLVDDNGVLTIPITDAPTADRSRIGDTLVATLAASLAAGLDLAQASRLGAIAIKLAACQTPTTPLRDVDLLAELGVLDGPAPKLLAASAEGWSE